MAIDDNTSYELTGYQVKDLAQKVRAKADSASLASVATSGLYSDLTGAPTIPTVYNGTLTITQNGTSAGTFTANASSDTTIALTDTTYSTMTGASSGTAGTSGLVPAPAAGDESKVLSGAGTWVNQSSAPTYTAGNGISISANDEISIDTSVVAELSDLPTVNDGTLTIVQNGTTVGTFTANQSANTTVNLAGGIYADDPTTSANPDGWITPSDIDWSTFTYSASEQRVGTWTNGKPVYKKTIDTGTMPNNTRKQVAHGISNLSFIISMSGSAYGNSTYLPIPYTDTTSANSLGLYASNTDLILFTSANLSYLTTSYVTIYYTKTTD